MFSGRFSDGMFVRRGDDCCPECSGGECTESIDCG